MVESKLLSTYKATPPPLLLFNVLGELIIVYPVILKGLRGVSDFNYFSAIEIILGFLSRPSINISSLSKFLFRL